MQIEIVTPRGTFKTRDYPEFHRDQPYFLLEDDSQLVLGENVIKDTIFRSIPTMAKDAIKDALKEDLPAMNLTDSEGDEEDMEEHGRVTIPRRNREAINALKDKVKEYVQTNGEITCFQAQKVFTGVQPATFRNIFKRLENEGVIRRVGQKRGTHYFQV